MTPTRMGRDEAKIMDACYDADGERSQLPVTGLLTHLISKVMMMMMMMMMMMDAGN